jgi:hypothetical protein
MSTCSDGYWVAAAVEDLLEVVDDLLPEQYVGHDVVGSSTYIRCEVVREPLVGQRHRLMNIADPLSKMNELVRTLDESDLTNMMSDSATHDRDDLVADDWMYDERIVLGHDNLTTIRILDSWIGGVR